MRLCLLQSKSVLRVYVLNMYPVLWPDACSLTFVKLDMQIFTVQSSRTERSYGLCRYYVDQHLDVQLDSTPVPSPTFLNGEVELLIDKNDSVFCAELDFVLYGSRVITMHFDWHGPNK